MYLVRVLSHGAGGQWHLACLTSRRGPVGEVSTAGPLSGLRVPCYGTLGLSCPWRAWQAAFPSSPCNFRSLGLWPPRNWSQDPPPQAWVRLRAPHTSPRKAPGPRFQRDTGSVWFLAAAKAGAPVGGWWLPVAGGGAPQAHSGSPQLRSSFLGKACTHLALPPSSSQSPQGLLECPGVGAGAHRSAPQSPQAGRVCPTS